MNIFDLDTKWTNWLKKPIPVWWVLIGVGVYFYLF